MIFSILVIISFNCGSTLSTDSLLLSAIFFISLATTANPFSFSPERAESFRIEIGPF